MLRKKRHDYLLKAHVVVVSVKMWKTKHISYKKVYELTLTGWLSCTILQPQDLGT